MTCDRCKSLERELARSEREKRTVIKAIAAVMRDFNRALPDKARQAAEQLFRRQE